MYPVHTLALAESDGQVVLAASAHLDGATACSARASSSGLGLAVAGRALGGFVAASSQETPPSREDWLLAPLLPIFLLQFRA